jgi:HEAT repeat protein
VHVVASVWGLTPKQSVEFECDRRSRSAVVQDCVAILRGRYVDDDFLRVLGGPPAEVVLEGQAGGLDGYWPRVWAARGLLHVWEEVATDAIIDVTTHDSWRVREMAAKVIARHHVRPAIDAVVTLLDDQNARVRAAASRAFRTIAD